MLEGRQLRQFFFHLTVYNTRLALQNSLYMGNDSALVHEVSEALYRCSDVPVTYKLKNQSAK